MFKCIIDTDQKTIQCGGRVYTIENGELYQATHPAVELFPKFFKEQKVEKPKRTKKVKIETAIEETVQAIDSIIPDLQEETIVVKKSRTPKESPIVEVKRKTNWFAVFFAIVSIIFVMGASIYLRMHGISTLLKLDYTITAFLVAAFITSEFTISLILFNEFKSKIHKWLNFVLLGGVQVVLICTSYVFEYSALSNMFLSQKNEIHVVDTQKENLEATLKDLDFQISNTQQQLSMCKEKELYRKNSLITKLNSISNKRTKVRNELNEFLTKNQATLSDRTGSENLSTSSGIDESQIMRTIAMVFAGMFNVLYLILIYFIVAEVKKFRESGQI